MTRVDLRALLAWLRPWQLGLLGALQVLPLLALSPGTRVETMSLGTAVFATGFTVAIYCWRAAARETGRHRFVFRGFVLAGATDGLLGGGLLLQALIGRDVAFQAGPEFGILVGPCVTGVVVLLMPVSRGRWLFFRGVLEVIAVSAALMLASWVWGVGRVFDDAELSGALQAVAAFAFVASLVRVGLMILSVEKARVPARRAQLTSLTMLLVASIAISVVEFGVWIAFLQQSSVNPRLLGVSLTIALLCVVWVAKQWQPVPNTPDARTPPGTGMSFAVVSVAIAASVPPLVVDNGLWSPATTVMGALTVLALVGRQWITLRENVALNRELEERVDLRNAQLAAREHFRALVQNSSDVVLAVTADLTVTYASDSTRVMLGVEAEALSGKVLTDLVSCEELESVRRAMHLAMIEPGVPQTAVWRARRSDGRLCELESAVTHLPHEPSIQGFVLNTRDVTERRELELQLEYQAFHDPLTSLPNRALFKNRLSNTVARFHRQEDNFAVLYCDLDGFKAINDTDGHAVGDALLTSVAQRLQACLRPGDTVARLGGDEFAVLLENTDLSEATAIADRIVASFSEPVVVDAKELTISTSMGIVMADGAPDRSIDDLMRDADLAMYVAKSLGRNRHVVFEATMQDEFRDGVVLTNDLRRALLSDEEIVLHYQPIFDLKTKSVTSVEALVRWQHPERGMIPPLDFIPLAEETGMILPLGEKVLRSACSQLAMWQREYGVSAPASVSVNLSCRQLQDDDIVNVVIRALSDAGLPTDALTLEITESLLLEGTDDALAKLHELRAIGVRLAIDDFGTGYSSLNYLRQFPVDVLKIDRAFINGLGSLDQDGRLVEAIMTMGRMLEIDTVAEGIETNSELSELENMGCDMGQGFLLARPVPAEKLRSQLAGESTVDNA